MRVADIGELGLIEMMRSFAGADAAGLLDDCAVLEFGHTRLAVTTDAHVEGVHFLPGRMAWRDIGYRALAACLSDLAAAGADGAPGYLVALGVPGAVAMDAVRELYTGMADLGEDVGGQLLGGDTVQSERMFISLTAMATVDRPMSRRGASPGDLVFVSGVPGAAGRALGLLLSGGLPDAAQAFLHPRPRLRLGQALRETGATACADVSDGLASELRSIARASGVGIEVHEDCLPLVEGLDRDASIDLAYGGGEDFELVFTAPPGLRLQILSLQQVHGQITEIGTVTAGAGVRALRGGLWREVPKSGYVHHGGGNA